ncbi:hypothetical protein AKJ08_0792 [Vulgatibacter incomptus]|uniref:Uncharacterized protein n=1 Tax=Vulgatibacter incomptus TaxID=1391653 RepID=A0A0K1PA61_9BACT|nr:hypothetical protein AKJ08_0792 [Vulgatibacter incomptus]
MPRPGTLALPVHLHAPRIARIRPALVSRGVVPALARVFGSGSWPCRRSESGC